MGLSPLGFLLFSSPLMEARLLVIGGAVVGLLAVGGVVLLPRRAAAVLAAGGVVLLSRRAAAASAGGAVGRAFVPTLFLWPLLMVVNVDRCLWPQADWPALLLLLPMPSWFLLCLLLLPRRVVIEKLGWENGLF